jgi:hypothetical protein
VDAGGDTVRTDDGRRRTKDQLVLNIRRNVPSNVKG